MGAKTAGGEGRYLDTRWPYGDPCYKGTAFLHQRPSRTSGVLRRGRAPNPAYPFRTAPDPGSLPLPAREEPYRWTRSSS